MFLSVKVIPVAIHANFHPLRDTPPTVVCVWTCWSFICGSPVAVSRMHGSCGLFQVVLVVGEKSVEGKSTSILVRSFKKSFCRTGGSEEGGHIFLLLTAASTSP